MLYTQPNLSHHEQQGLGPLGLLPYPVSYRIVYGEPLNFHERFGPEGADDTRLVRYLANQVRRTVQQLIDRNRS